MRRVVFVWVASVCAMAALPRAGVAQGGGVPMDLNVGGAWLRQHGIPQSAVGSYGGTIVGQTDRAGWSAAVLGACGAHGQCTGQGVANAAVYAAPGQRARWELGLTTSDIALDGATPTTSAQLTAREYVGGPWRAAYAGVGAGGVHAAITRGIALAELGGWWEGSAGRWGIDLRAMRVPTSAQLFRLAQGLSTPGAPTFGDLAASWSRDAGRVSMSATSGWRALLRGGGERPGLWASASVTTWVTPRMGVVVAAGRALEDLTRGAPEARYASLSLRVRVHGPAARIPPRTFPPSMPVVAATALAGGTKEIRVRVRGATRVEVMADFTDWMPRALRREGDNWTLVAAMPPGPHRLAVRIDGGAWQVPGNLPTVHDEFGGAFGLIAVP